MVLPKLQTGARVADHAYEAIYAAVVNGEYAAGDRLQIRDLAAELGISVMPVREALTRLEEAGLVETQPYRGAVVKHFTPEALLEVYAVRRLLEAEASRLGATRLSAAALARLESVAEAMSQAVARHDVIEYLDRDEELLAGIYSAAGNAVLLESIRALWARCRHFKIFGVREELEAGDAERLIVHQRELLRAVSAGDADAAAAVTVESIDAAIGRIELALAEPDRAHADA